MKDVQAHLEATLLQLSETFDKSAMAVHMSMEALTLKEDHKLPIV